VINPRAFHGWRIVAAGFVLEMLMGALLFHAYGAYVVMLRQEFGWSKTLFSAAFSMARAESGILGPIQGWLTDRFGPRTLIRIGMTVFGLAFILFSQIGSAPAFFITFFLMALGSSLGGYLPVAVAIVSWFRRRRALALSISSTGMPVGGLLTQVVALALSAIGWRWTAFLSGVLVLSVGVPLARVFRHRSQARGEWPDGEAPAAEEARAAGGRAPAPTTGVDFTPREAMRAPALWYISLGHGSALLVVSAVSVHLIVHVTEQLGYSLQQAAAVVALMTVMQVSGQLGGGWAGDRFNKRAIVVGCMLADDERPSDESHEGLPWASCGLRGATPRHANVLDLASAAMKTRTRHSSVSRITLHWYQSEGDIVAPQPDIRAVVSQDHAFAIRGVAIRP